MDPNTELYYFSVIPVPVTVVHYDNLLQLPSPLRPEQFVMIPEDSLYILSDSNQVLVYNIIPKFLPITVLPTRVPYPGSGAPQQDHHLVPGPVEVKEGGQHQQVPHVKTRRCGIKASVDSGGLTGLEYGHCRTETVTYQSINCHSASM